jgi:hypothetical protein
MTAGAMMRGVGGAAGCRVSKIVTRHPAAPGVVGHVIVHLWPVLVELPRISQPWAEGHHASIEIQSTHVRLRSSVISSSENSV